jgi:hypothetical protein
VRRQGVDILSLACGGVHYIAARVQYFDAPFAAVAQYAVYLTDTRRSLGRQSEDEKLKNFGWVSSDKLNKMWIKLY